jgi:hypothetical protein
LRNKAHAARAERKQKTPENRAAARISRTAPRWRDGSGSGPTAIATQPAAA